MGPYHAGIEPYHEVGGRGSGQEAKLCSGSGGGLGGGAELWVPYTALLLLFLLLGHNSVTSWAARPRQVNTTTILYCAVMC